MTVAEAWFFLVGIAIVGLAVMAAIGKFFIGLL